MDIWTYVITHDSGSAPNFEPPATTLAICKPRIRKYAKKGEVVLAFNGATLNRNEPHSVCWAGVVAEIIPYAKYWRDPRFGNKKPGRSKRPDNIYEPTDDEGLKQVRNNSHLPRDISKDTGGKNVLVLRPSWYFGVRVAVLPVHFGLRMGNGRRGERKTTLSALRWRILQRWLDMRVPKTAGRPLVKGQCGPCEEKYRPRKRYVC